MLAHGLDQHVAPAPLLGPDRPARRVAGGIETVEARAHVEAVVGAALRDRSGTRSVRGRRVKRRRRRGRGLDQREIDGRARRMLRSRADIAAQQRSLRHSREEALGWSFRAAVIHPFRHGAHGARRPIAIINLEREPRGRKLRLHALERGRDIPPENAFRGFIAGQRPADEIVGAGIPNLLRDGRVDVAQINEAGRQRALRRNVLHDRDKHRCNRGAKDPRSNFVRLSANEWHPIS